MSLIRRLLVGLLGSSDNQENQHQDAFREVAEMEETEKAERSEEAKQVEDIVVDAPKVEETPIEKYKLGQGLSTSEYNSQKINGLNMFYRMIEEEILTRINNGFKYTYDLPITPPEQEEMGRFTEIANCVETPWNKHESILWVSIKRGIIERYPHKEKKLTQLVKACAQIDEENPGFVYQKFIRAVCNRQDVKKRVKEFYAEYSTSKKEREKSMQDLLDE